MTIQEAITSARRLRSTEITNDEMIGWLSTHDQQLYNRVLRNYGEPQPEKLRGDVDANGKVELPDVIMMQKYLLNIGKLSDAAQGDMNEDGATDIFDLALMKRELLRK